MRVGRSSKAPGRPGSQRQAVGTCTCAWQSSPQRSRRAVGKRTSGAAHGIASGWPQANMPIRSLWPWPGHEVPACGPWPSRLSCRRTPQDDGVWTYKLARFPTSLGRGAAPVWCHPRQREEADRYARPSREAGTRRMQGRWYPTHGYQREQPSRLTGSGSSDREKGKYEADVKKLLPTLDIGSHINAGHQAR